MASHVVSPGARCSTGRTGSTEPDSGRVFAGRVLAVWLAVVALLAAWPAIGQGYLATGPLWAQAAIMVALVQLAYVAWMAVLPDWSSLRVVVVVYGLAVAVYAVPTAVALASPAHYPLPWGMEPYRRSAANWGGLVVVMTTLVAYISGRMAAAWEAEDRVPRTDDGGGRNAPKAQR